MFEKLKKFFQAAKCTIHPNESLQDFMGDDACYECIKDSWRKSSEAIERDKQRKMVDACKVALVEMHVVNFKDLPDHLKDLVEGDEWKTDTTSK